MSRRTATWIVVAAIISVAAVYIYFGIQIFYGGLGDV